MRYSRPCHSSAQSNIASCMQVSSDGYLLASVGLLGSSGSVNAGPHMYTAPHSDAFDPFCAFWLSLGRVNFIQRIRAAFVTGDWRGTICDHVNREDRRRTRTARSPDEVLCPMRPCHVSTDSNMTDTGETGRQPRAVHGDPGTRTMRSDLRRRQPGFAF